MVSIKCENGRFFFKIWDVTNYVTQNLPVPVLWTSLKTRLRKKKFFTVLIDQDLRVHHFFTAYNDLLTAKRDLEFQFSQEKNIFFEKKYERTPNYAITPNNSYEIVKKNNRYRKQNAEARLVHYKFAIITINKQVFQKDVVYKKYNECSFKFLKPEVEILYERPYKTEETFQLFTPKKMGKTVKYTFPQLMNELGNNGEIYHICGVNEHVLIENNFGTYCKLFVCKNKYDASRLYETLRHVFKKKIHVWHWWGYHHKGDYAYDSYKKRMQDIIKKQRR